MAQSLVEAIAEVENIRQEKEASIKEVAAQNERAFAEMKKLKEDYFRLTQEIRKSETSGIAAETKEKLLKKWRNESK